jgi:hypothetical protein
MKILAAQIGEIGRHAYNAGNDSVWIVNRLHLFAIASAVVFEHLHHRFKSGSGMNIRIDFDHAQKKQSRKKNPKYFFVKSHSCLIPTSEPSCSAVTDTILSGKFA